MNEGRQGSSADRLQDAWNAGWWGATAAAADAGAPEQHPPGSLPHHAQGNGWMSWIYSKIGGGGSSSSSSAKAERRAARRQARPTVQRSRPTTADGSAAPPRLPRPQSTPKLPRPPPAAGGAAGKPPQAPPQQQQQAAGSPAPPGEATAAQQPVQPTQQQQAAAADTRRRVARQAAKQADYAERRQAWRRRIDAIKAKQAGRQAATAGAGGEGASAGAAGPGAGPRVYSKHVAIPLAPGAARGPSQSTPHGSPNRRDPLLAAAEAALPELEVPPVWLGFQTAEAPADAAAASDEQLRRFLQQAGWGADAAAALPDHDALVAAARGARGAWEVERVICACTWPEEVLRVPRKCGDAAVLRAAYKKMSIAVHPDKCSAVGASDAMSIVSDCFSMLTAAAASGSQAVKAVPAFMRTGASRSNLAAAAGESGGGSGGGGGSQASQRPPSPQPPPQQQQQGQHIRHASVDSLPGGLADPAAWAGAEQAQQAAHLQAGQPAPSRSSSGGVEAPPVGRPHSGSSDGWNPLGQLSSEEREAAAAAAANWERTNGGWPAAATRSRSSSAASLAGSAQGQAQMHAHTNGSSSSLASPGSSQHGGAQYPGSQHGSQHGGAAFPAAAGEAAADPPPAGPPRPSSAGAGGSAAPPRPSSAGAAPRPKPAGAVLRITLKVRPA